ncbi:MAG: V-type ATPase subunit subunit G family protein [Coriobacteriia bacterium]|nr:V-type ATPase subunit subunit G family protein [Coriobacteriia bacterium]
MVDDKVLEEIRFHQDVVEHESGSPLHQIREKEMEISGRVLAAKQQADEIVAEARRRAADIVGKAQSEGDRLARDFEQKSLADAEKEAKVVKEQAVVESAQLEEALVARRDIAAQAVVEAVTGL